METPTTETTTKKSSRKESGLDRAKRYGFSIADKLATAALCVLCGVLYTKITTPKTQA